MNRILLILSFIIGFMLSLTAIPFSLNVEPGIVIPLDRTYGYGITADLLGSSALINHDNSQFSLDVNYGLSYGYIPFREENRFVNLFTADLGARLDLNPLPNLYTGLDLRGGYSFMFANNAINSAGYSPFAAGGLHVIWRLSPVFELGARGMYNYYYALMQNVTANIEATYHLTPKTMQTPGPRKTQPPGPLKTQETPEKTPGLPMEGGIKLSDLEFNIFPIHFKYYDSHPVGQVTITNYEKVRITSVNVSLYAKKYMDYPKLCSIIEALEPGEEKRIDLFALLSSDVLEITEGTKVSCQFIVEYQKGKEKVSKEIIETMDLYNRNAIIWDDDRKAASFVTAKDPEILKFSKKVAGMISGKYSKALDKNLITAMAIHEALRLYGISYVPDPSTPYIELSASKAVDFLQFPKQTMEYQAGDCDDLSILYAALLESVGIETAFITIPGHIFTAFALEMTPANARKSLQKTSDLLFTDTKVWVPIEITLREEGFLKIWQTGARQWYEYAGKEQAVLFPVHEAWKIFEPVGFNLASDPLKIPDSDKVVKNFTAEVDRYIRQELFDQITNLENKIATENNQAIYINKLGNLYAQYGIYDKALQQYNSVLLEGDFFPTLLNVGNIHFLAGNLGEAENYYNRALSLKPDYGNVILAVARVNHEMENYGTAKKMYQKLVQVSPELAKRFSYLDLRGEEADRAADITGMKEVVLWEDE